MKDRQNNEDVSAVVMKLSLFSCVFPSECLNCNSISDMNGRINAIESKVKKIPLAYAYVPVSIPYSFTNNFLKYVKVSSRCSCSRSSC